MSKMGFLDLLEAKNFKKHPVTSSPAVDQSEFSSYLVHFNEGGGAEGSDIGN